MDFNNRKYVQQRSYEYFFNAIGLSKLKELEEYIKENFEFDYNTGEINPNASSKKTTATNLVQQRKSYYIESDEYIINFEDVLNGYIVKANENQFDFDLLDICQFYYFEYGVEENLKNLDWHMDLANPYPYNERKLSFSLMMNDPSEYEGGQLEIWIDSNKTIKIPKTQGGLVIFPSFMPHRVTAITKGVRKSIVGFICGRPFR